MSKLRVQIGKSGHNLVDALARARPGDTILFGPGDYAIGNIRVRDIHLIGDGVSGSVTLHGMIHVDGGVQISNIVVRAQPFENALNVRGSGAHLELNKCAVYGEPTGKYPAVFVSGGVAVIRNSSVFHDAGHSGVAIEDRGVFHAEGSAVAFLSVVGSQAYLTECQAFTVMCRNRAKLETFGTLSLFPQEGLLALAVRAESSCVIDRLTLDRSAPEADCDESFLQLGSVEVSGAGVFLVKTKGQAVVETASASVSVREASMKESTTEQASTVSMPKAVLWPLSEARCFASKVAPQLSPGDTLLLEEGEYFLEDYDDCLRIDIDIAGKGPAEQTVLHGSLVVNEGSAVALTNLTIRTTGEDQNAVTSRGTLNMVNVVLEGKANASKPLLYAGKGTVSMRESYVLAAEEIIGGGIDIDGGAQLGATDSYLGWLRVVNGSTAQLSNCRSQVVSVHTDSKVTSGLGHHLEENSLGQRELWIADSSSADFEQLTTDSQVFEAFVGNSCLTIASFDHPAGSDAVMYRSGQSEINVHGARVLVREEGEPVQKQTHSSGPVLTQPLQESPGEERAALAGSQGAEENLPEQNDPLTAINELIGLEKVKAEAQSFIRNVQFNQMRESQGLRGTDLTMHSLFLGNPGTGKTTVARLLGQALFKAGAVASDSFLEVGRRDLVSENIGGSANLTHAVLERARGGVLFIDEAYSLYQENNNEFAQEAVDTLLAFMENNRKDIVVIFAGYTDRMQDFLSMNPGLRSRVPNRFDFEDYTPEEIARIGYSSLLEEQYSVDEDRYRRAVMTQYGRSSDKSNGRWVRNFNQELIKEMAYRVTTEGSEDLTSITLEDLNRVVGGIGDQAADIEALLSQLDSMVGLVSVKEWVRKLVNRVKVDQRRMDLDGSASRPSYHMVFTGNPGTGKTTVARIIAQLFNALGILENSAVKEVDRSSLVGSFIGHTERNTSRALDEAMGGVLFVDEAYQLDIEGSENDFGKQAIETFMTRLENDRDKFVAIFAGYTENMDRFLGANPGLRSRVPLILEFPDYSPDEVAQLVVMGLSKEWTFDRELVASIAAQAYEAAAPQDRSNGRWARNFSEQIAAEQIEYIAREGLAGESMKQIPEKVLQGFARSS